MSPSWGHLGPCKGRNGSNNKWVLQTLAVVFFTTVAWPRLSFFVIPCAEGNSRRDFGLRAPGAGERAASEWPHPAFDLNNTMCPTCAYPQPPTSLHLGSTISSAPLSCKHLGDLIHESLCVQVAVSRHIVCAMYTDSKVLCHEPSGDRLNHCRLQLMAP